MILSSFYVCEERCNQTMLLFQPVAQPHIFYQVGDAYARLYVSGSLWMDEFSMLELDEIMRQKEDGEFARTTQSCSNC